jgi:DNA-binding transcriptional ArsR family regulator
MGLSDLVDLATRFVALSAELDTIRAGMKRLLLNGGGGVEPPGLERPTLARRLGEKKKPQAANVKRRDAKEQLQPQHPNALKAKAAETQIFELLRAETDGMKTIDVARATGMPPTSVQNRLSRLQRAGLIERSADERWSAASAPN